MRVYIILFVLLFYSYSLYSSLGKIYVESCSIINREFPTDKFTDLIKLYDKEKIDYNITTNDSKALLNLYTMDNIIYYQLDIISKETNKLIEGKLKPICFFPSDSKLAMVLIDDWTDNQLDYEIIISLYEKGIKVVVNTEDFKEVFLSY